MKKMKKKRLPGFDPDSLFFFDSENDENGGDDGNKDGNHTSA